MPKVISFLSRKGGCGKTTNAVNTAKELQRQGFSVTLIETDKNYTPTALKSIEVFLSPSSMDIRPVIGSDLTADNIKKAIKCCTKDFVIVDGAGEMSATILYAVSCVSDVVLIPTNLDSIDIESTEKTLRDIMQGGKLNPKLKMAILPARVHWLTKQETVMQILAHLQTDVLPYIPVYNEYKIQANKNPGTIYRNLVSLVLKMMTSNKFQPPVTFRMEENVTATSGRYFYQCAFSKCELGNPKGWFYTDRKDKDTCCDTHRVYANREKKGTIALN